jgi:ferric-dicitrate binding protein FerR (iron transport regulator)
VTTNSCPQAPLVEAFHDGRLSTSDSASVERHLAVCITCAAEKRSYERIRDALRAPRETATELEHQRARGALLRAAANQGRDLGAEGPINLASRGRSRPYLLLAFAATFFAATLGIGWLWGRASAPRAATSAAPPAAFVDTSVVPSDGARFERTRGGGIDTVTLSSGTLSVATGTRTTERVIVKTNDAELEAKDSAFHIEADSGRIRNVIVERGSVEVRYAGFIAVIPAGGSWHGGETAAVESAPAQTAVPQATVPTAVAIAVAPPPVAVLPHTTTAPAPVTRVAAADTRPREEKSVKAAEPPPVVAPPPPPVPATGKVFSSAMRTLERGDFDGAATALGAFADAHPDDPRSDDADYVRAIALERAGHTAEAKSAAHRYLANRPNGAHRREAQQIANR